MGGFSQIVVTAEDAESGSLATIKLRGQRSSGCNAPKRMEDGVICYSKRQGPLTVSFHAADNPGLAPGRYRATFDVEAVGWHTSFRSASRSRWTSATDQPPPGTREPSTTDGSLLLFLLRLLGLGFFRHCLRGLPRADAFDLGGEFALQQREEIR